MAVFSSISAANIDLQIFYKSMLSKINKPELHKEIFNLCLVYADARPAMLLETANYRELLTSFFVEVVPKDIFRCVSDEFRLPRYFIFKKNKFRDIEDVSFSINNDRPISDDIIGNIIGFNCPGDMRGLWSITYYINNEPFYAEKCNDYDTIKEKQQEQSSRFRQVAEKIGLEFKEVIKKNLSNDEIISAIKSSDKNTIIEHKNIIGSIYYDIGLAGIGESIFNENIDGVLLETMKTEPNIELVRKYFVEFSGGSRKYNIKYNKF